VKSEKNNIIKTIIIITIIFSLLNYKTGFTNQLVNAKVKDMIKVYKELEETGIEKLGYMRLNEIKKEINDKFKNSVPVDWGYEIKGIKTHVNTKEKIMCLTFDACGDSQYVNDYDKDLIDFLEKGNIPATLFLSGLWIDRHPDIAKQLSQNPLFEIENHGLKHKPLSINGQRAYGIKGTASIDEVIDEIEINSMKIQSITGKKPLYFRSGTAHYDDISIKIANMLGYEVVNFSINGDGGATYSRQEIKEDLSNVIPGDIIIFHMNYPEGDTAEGIMDAIPELKKKGFKFLKLNEVNL